MGFRAVPIALSEACTNDDAQLAKTLFDKYAKEEPHYRHSRLFNVAVQAVRQSRPAVLSLCFDYGLSVDDGGTGSTIITAAHSIDSVPVFELLVNRGGIDVNQHLGLYGDLLTSAVHNNNLEVVRFLLARGADPNSGATIIGHNALVHAVGKNEILRALFDYGANVNGIEPLIAAAYTGDLEAVKMILHRTSSPLDLEEITRNTSYYSPWAENPETALFKAAAGGYAEIVDVLVRRGANIAFKDRHGRSVVDVAKENGHRELANRLAQLMYLWDAPSDSNASHPSQCVKATPE